MVANIMYLESPLGFSALSNTRQRHVAVINPEQAQWILTQMHPRQRSLRPSAVDSFKQLMLSGQFVEEMDPGIYFNRTGHCVNAQHRLTAQVKAQKTLRWTIVTGASDAEIAALDQVSPRRIYQSVNLCEDVSDQMSSREEAIIKGLLKLSESGSGCYNDSFKRYPLERILEARAAYQKEITWALQTIPPRSGPASVVMIAAFSHPVSPKRVAGFFDAYNDQRLSLCSGVFTKNHPGVTFARFMNQFGGNRAGGAYTQGVVLKGLSAIKAHIEGRELSKLYENSDVTLWFRAQRARMGIDR
jgi:hypothetical protein